MFGLIRHFALEEMSKQHEYEFACRHTHAQYLADFYAQREHALQTGGQTAACAQMESESQRPPSGWRFAVARAAFAPGSLSCPHATVWDLCNLIEWGKVLFAHGCSTLRATLRSQPDDQARCIFYGGLLVGHGLFLLRQRDYGQRQKHFERRHGLAERSGQCPGR